MDNSCQKVLLWPLNAQRIHKHSRKRNNNSRHLQNFICISFVYIQYTHTHTRESEQKKERKKKERKLRIVVEKKNGALKKGATTRVKWLFMPVFRQPYRTPMHGPFPSCLRIYICKTRSSSLSIHTHTESHTHARNNTRTGAEDTRAGFRRCWVKANVSSKPFSRR